jgi:hypothetical protein
MEYAFGDVIVYLIIIMIIINLVDVFKNMIWESYKKWRKSQDKK